MRINKYLNICISNEQSMSLRSILIQNQIKQLSMNTSYRDSGDSPTIVQWFKKHTYPHCRTVTNLSSLRTGIAIAEILAEKLPPAYHPLFLPNIEIYNLSPQRSILNLKVMLNTLKSYYSQHPELIVCIEEFSAQGLYFDHNMMETFLFTVIMPLQVQSDQVPSDEILREAYQGAEEISDIANLSSIIVNEWKHVEIEKGSYKMIMKAGKDKQSLDRSQLKIQKICKWLLDCFHINAQQLAPEYIMGQLVNSMFTGSRLDHQKVIKQSHYQLGSAIVFKKVGDFLLTCERMPKQNVLSMLQEVDSGCMREQLFWSVIEDMMNIRTTHHMKMHRKKSSERGSSNREINSVNKENVANGNVIVEKKAQSVKKIVEHYECNSKTLQMAESWIRDDLGYDHSLTKSKTASKVEQNPLLNGVLLGSIVMRMQLGRLSINKQPKRKCQIDVNMSEVINCIIRRGIEAGRKFSKFKPEYKTYLGIIWDVKEEWEKKVTLEKTKRAEQSRVRKQMVKDLTQTEKKAIISWLKSRGIQIQLSSFLPVQIVSHICGQILQLRLFRQTTKRIRQSNMQKILNELRRLGWQGDHLQVLSEQSSNMRWSMLSFAYNLVKDKVYYYR